MMLEEGVRESIGVPMLEYCEEIQRYSYSIDE